MRRTWFYRLLLSYLPIFFIVTSFLFFIFFQYLNERTKKEAVNANYMLVHQVMDKIDTIFFNIDLSFTHFSIENKILPGFFNDTSLNPYLNYLVLKEMNNFKQQNPLVDSIYLVRTNDSKVLSEKALFNLDQFPDRGYISTFSHQQLFKWSNVRPYKEFSFKASKNVVSLVRTVYPKDGKKGYVVINVQTKAIENMLKTLYNPKVSFIRIYDSQKMAVVDYPNKDSDQMIITKFESSYTKWNYEGGFSNGDLFTVISFASSIWVKLGIIVSFLGILSIIYLTRKNYSPLEEIVARIGTLSLHKQEKDFKKFSEFRMIESAISNIMNKNSQYQKQIKEDTQLRKSHFFYEVIEGIRHISDKEWQDEIKKYGVPVIYRESIVLSVEIDHYVSFCNDYSANDQYLIKYAFVNVINEILNSNLFFLLGEWTSAKHYTCILLMDSLSVDRQNRMRDSCQDLIQWIRDHFHMSVTVGIGKEVFDIADIPLSYKGAQTVLKFKSVLGIGRILDSAEVEDYTSDMLFQHLERVRGIVYAFRTFDEDWRNLCHNLFDQLRKQVLPIDDIVSLLNYFIYQLDRNVTEYTPELLEIWKTQGFAPLIHALDHLETLDEIQQVFEQQLSQIFELMYVTREKKTHHQMIRKVREYIQLNYTNSELSLDHLSSEFGINPKYLSQLFKDEFGERFIDFVISLRLDHAKKLLMETDKQVQEISVEVGYENVISFSRIFKKLTGLSPGEYRKRDYLA